MIAAEEAGMRISTLVAGMVFGAALWLAPVSLQHGRLGVSEAHCTDAEGTCCYESGSVCGLNGQN